MPWVIRNWETHYENAQSRKVKEAGWVPIPNKHDGKGFRRIASYEKRCEIFSAWILMLQLASKMPRRGVLADNDGDLTAADMAVKTGFPEHIFEIAFQALSDVKIGWIELVDRSQLPAYSHYSGSTPGQSVAEGKGTEQKGTEGNGNKRICAEAPEGLAADSGPVVLRFPCVAGKKSQSNEWLLTEAKLREYQDTYRGVAVREQCRRAWQWCQDNSSNRKTVAGMPAFLSRWLSREQNKSGGFYGGTNSRKQAGQQIAEAGKYDHLG